MSFLREPAPRSRLYVGHRERGQAGPCTVQRVEADGTRTPLDPRNDLSNHSPDGFQWGYAGSGPAQLALAMIADATGNDALALRVHQRFKREVVMIMADQWMMDAGNVADFAQSLNHIPPEQVW